MAKSKYIETLEEQYTKKDAKSVLRYKAPDNKWRYVQTSKDASGGTPMPSGGMEEVTWQELKDKRDNGELNPGSLYRITDYQCTTTQENTQSANHQFDIVLLALSNNKLAEEGWAMEHPTDVYDVTFSDGVTKKCYIYIFNENGLETFWVIDTDTLLGVTSSAEEFSLNKNNKTATTSDYESIDLVIEGLNYNYFQNSNLSAWKVWYCLDNDKSRFAWAMGIQPASVIMSDGKSEDSFIRTPEGDANNKYCWLRDAPNFAFWTDSDTPQNGDSIYNTNGEIISGCSIVSYTPSQEGRGVIYRLIDEWGNDVPYDFKNILFTIDNHTCYTFDIEINGEDVDYSVNGANVYGNKISKIVDESKAQIVNGGYIFINNEDVIVADCLMGGTYLEGEIGVKSSRIGFIFGYSVDS